MEIMGTIGFWYFTTFQCTFLLAVIVPVVSLWLLKAAIRPNGKQREYHDKGLNVDDKALQEKYEAKIAELTLENKKLQDNVYNYMTLQHSTAKENDDLKGTIVMLQKENKGMRKKIMLLNKNNETTEMEFCRQVKAVSDQVFGIKKQLTAERHRKDSRIQALEKELKDKEEAWKIEIASLQAAAHKRLMKTSALERNLTEKKTEVFFLHHRLLDLMDWVAELRGTKFVPLPLYPHNQKPSHKRVRDGWRKILTQSRLQHIPEESGDFTLHQDPREASFNQAIFYS